jgi:CMP-N-acetylneuraminic acid synthetase
MTDKSDISVVIPVREGSSRIENKIFLPFGENKTLLEWKIEQMLEFHPPERVFLSSNSARVESVASDCGINYIRRDDYLCDGHKATFSEVITGIIKDIPTEHFAWATVVVPLMAPSEYSEAFSIYMEEVVEKSLFDSLVSVNLMRDYLWGEDGPLNYRADRYHTISQDLPNIYRVTNGLYMSSKTQALRLGYFLGPNPRKHLVSKISGIDIDEAEDYEMACALKSLYPQALKTGE